EKARRATQLRLESGTGEGNMDWSPDEATQNADAPDAMLEADDERQNLLRRMQRLDERERSILTLRVGLHGEHPVTLKEVGRRLGVTREWVRKIEIRAVRKLDDSEPLSSDDPLARRDRIRGSVGSTSGRDTQKPHIRQAVESSRSA